MFRSETASFMTSRRLSPLSPISSTLTTGPCSRYVAWRHCSDSCIVRRYFNRPTHAGSGDQAGLHSPRAVKGTTAGEQVDSDATPTFFQAASRRFRWRWVGRNLVRHEGVRFSDQRSSMAGFVQQNENLYVSIALGASGPRTRESRSWVVRPETLLASPTDGSCWSWCVRRNGTCRAGCVIRLRRPVERLRDVGST